MILAILSFFFLARGIVSSPPKPCERECLLGFSPFLLSFSPLKLLATWLLDTAHLQSLLASHKLKDERLADRFKYIRRNSNRPLSIQKNSKSCFRNVTMAAVHVTWHLWYSVQFFYQRLVEIAKCSTFEQTETALLPQHASAKLVCCLQKKNEREETLTKTFK